MNRVEQALAIELTSSQRHWYMVSPHDHILSEEESTISNMVLSDFTSLEQKLIRDQFTKFFMSNFQELYLIEESFELGEIPKKITVLNETIDDLAIEDFISEVRLRTWYCIKYTDIIIENFDLTIFVVSRRALNEFSVGSMIYIIEIDAPFS